MRKFKKVIKVFLEHEPKEYEWNRKGPSEYFYEKIIRLRKKNSVKKFLSSEYNVELLYAALGCWDMNNRGAKMKGFSEFKKNLQLKRTLNVLNYFENNFIKKEMLDNNDFGDTDTLLKRFNENNQTEMLLNAYNAIDVMKSKSKLVATSKTLHFLFNKTIMPIDRGNLLVLYGNDSNSPVKFVKIQLWAYSLQEIIEKQEKKNIKLKEIDNILHEIHRKNLKSKNED